MIYANAFFFSLFITIALIPILKGLAIHLNAAIDLPGGRKIHTKPVPKIGGIAMAIGAFLPILFLIPLNSFMNAILIGAGIIIVFGILDDCLDLSYKIKFLVQIIAALIAIYYGNITISNLGGLLPQGISLPGYIAIPLTLLAIVGVTNAVNLSDGLDGLAGGVSLLTYICICLIAYQGEKIGITLLAITMIGSILGFLRFNTHPALIFMGDAGSQLLGFLSITLSIALTQGNSPLSPLLPILLVGFSVMDTLAVMAERIVRGLPVFKADNNHVHHKLMKLGFFHSEAVFLIYLLQALLISTSYILRFHDDLLLLSLYLILASAFLGGFYLADRKRWHVSRHIVWERKIKGKLKITARNTIIKYSSRIISIGIPLLFLFSSCMPDANKIQGYPATITTILAIFLFLLWWIQKKYMGIALRFVIFLIIPFIVYHGETNPATWINNDIKNINYLFMGFIIIFTFLTLKHTRREQGFKASPLDFLVLFIAIILPNLPDKYIQSYNLGTISMKIIVFFFCYEVLLGELRGKYTSIAFATIFTLVLFGSRGLLLF